jgi:hypothetical protein
MRKRSFPIYKRDILFGNEKKNVVFFSSKSAYNKEFLAIFSGTIENEVFPYIRETYFWEMKKNVGFFGTKSANNKEILAVHEKTKFSHI